MPQLGVARLRAVAAAVCPRGQQAVSAEEPSSAGPVADVPLAQEDRLEMRWETAPTRLLVSTDMMLGCAFNRSVPGMAAPCRADCVATVKAALRYNWSLDTAPLYRDSEEALGQAYSDVVGDGAESSLLASQLWTKIGLRTGGEWSMDPSRCSWVTHGMATAASAKQSVHESMERLGLKKLAGARVHDIPGGDLPTTDDLIDAALAPGGMVEGLLELRSQGSIGEVSLGMNANGAGTGKRDSRHNPSLFKASTGVVPESSQCVSCRLRRAEADPPPAAGCTKGHLWLRSDLRRVELALPGRLRVPAPVPAPRYQRPRGGGALRGAAGGWHTERAHAVRTRMPGAAAATETVARTGR
jgi:hypothetical protein